VLLIGSFGSFSIYPKTATLFSAVKMKLLKSKSLAFAIAMKLFALTTQSPPIALFARRQYFLLGAIELF